MRGIGRDTEEAWKLLHCPTGIPEDGLPDTADLNFFDHSESFIRKRAEKLQSVLTVLGAVINGIDLERKLVSGRYDSGLSKVPRKALVRLHQHLSGYLEATQLSSDKA